MKPDAPFAAILERFELNGHFDSAEPFGSGHINDTYLVRFALADRRTRYVLQRINASVFPDPAALMDNLDRVTTHLRSRARKGDPVLGRQGEFLPVRARDGASWCRDGNGDYWRLFPYLFGTVSVDTVDGPERARRAGAAFGRFQKLLTDLPPLAATIAGFHDTVRRYRTFEDAVARDAAGRAGDCAAEIGRARRFEEDATVLARLEQRGELPLRIAHNDAKINNVLFDEGSEEPICIVDLDTVMPGLALHDFGDLVRTATSTAREDTAGEADVSMRNFAALAEGYLGEAAQFLEPAETKHLAAAGFAITVETGLRFLTDHLDGDRYFRIQRPGHNLDRCRAQFALADAIAAKLPRMQAEVESLLEGIRAGNAAHA